MGAANIDWFAYVKEGGAWCAPLLLGAVFWMNAERVRLLQELKESNSQKDALTERVLTIVAELKIFLFNERRQ